MLNIKCKFLRKRLKVAYFPNAAISAFSGFIIGCFFLDENVDYFYNNIADSVAYEFLAFTISVVYFIFGSVFFGLSTALKRSKLFKSYGNYVYRVSESVCDFGVIAGIVSSVFLVFSGFGFLAKSLFFNFEDDGEIITLIGFGFWFSSITLALIFIHSLFRRKLYFLDIVFLLTGFALSYSALCLIGDKREVHHNAVYIVWTVSLSYVIYKCWASECKFFNRAAHSLSKSISNVDICYFIFFSYFSIVVIYGVFYKYLRVSSTELTWVESIYFSFVTITTLGFGDILPSNDLGMIMVSSEAVLGILLIGLFLNSLSNRLGRRIREKEIEIECNRKEQLRKSLEKHVSILLINFETGDPFSWSDSADDLPSPSDYESQLHDLRKFLDVDKNISDLNVKMLLETCDQHYEILISLTSAAAEISSVHLMRWSSLLVSVKTLKDSYDKIKSDEKYGQFSWPEFGLIRKDVSRIISVAEFLRVGNSI